MSGWEGFVEEVEEFLADVCIYIVTVWWIEPGYVAGSCAVFLGVGFVLLVFEFIVVAAFVEGILVSRFGAIKGSYV